MRGLASPHPSWVPLMASSSGDPAPRCPCARGPARHAAGGTAGGSTDDRVLLFVTYSGLWNSSSTFQFLLVVEDQVLVFKVFPLDSVQQRRPSCTSLTFPVEVFKVLALDRFHQRLRLFTLQLVRTMTRMCLAKGFFRTFPRPKKSAKVASHQGSELPPHPSSWTAAAQLEDSVEWVRLREKHAGKTYFWNRRTNSSVWRAPDGVNAVWYGEKDEKGGVWCWHRDTRVSTFILPPLPPG